MKRFGLIVLPLFFCLSALPACSGRKVKESPPGSAAEPPKSEVIPLAGSIKVNKFVLDNGLRLLVVEDHSSPTFAYHTWFRVGSRDEAPGRTGLAHLFEHMMFKETKNLKEGEFDRLLEQAGAQGENAFTSRDYTAYIEEMPKDKLALVAKLEADRMVNLTINDAAFKTEREVVQNERRFRNENNPDGLMNQELYNLSFTKHSYRWPVIGYQEDLDHMTSENALEFYRSYYSPNHATVVVVGDVEPGEVKSLIEQYYGDLSPSAEVPKAIPQEPSQTHPRRKVLPLNIQVQKLIIAFRAPELESDDTPALEALQIILGGGKSSRLSRTLVNTGIASAVEAYNSGDKDPSLFVIELNLQKKQTAENAEAVVLKQLWQLAKAGVPPDELEKAKNKINFSFYENLESNYAKAQFLGHFEAVAGNFTAGVKLHDKINQLTPQDIQNVVKKYLLAEKRIVIVGVPK